MPKDILIGTLCGIVTSCTIQAQPIIEYEEEKRNEQLSIEPQPTHNLEILECSEPEEITYDHCDALRDSLTIGERSDHPTRKTMMKWYGELKFQRDIYNEKRKKIGKKKRPKNYHGIPQQNEVKPHIVTETLMGYPFRVHESVAPLFECIERDIRLLCSGEDQKYEIKGPQEGCNFSKENCLSHGWREKNAYSRYLSTHMFGATWDINPGTNQITRKLETDIPECWVAAHENYCVLWGGSEEWVMRENKGSRNFDPMHFQFVCNPSVISTTIDDHQKQHKTPYYLESNTQ